MFQVCIVYSKDEWLVENVCRFALNGDISLQVCFCSLCYNRISRSEQVAPPNHKQPRITSRLHTLEAESHTCHLVRSLIHGLSLDSETIFISSCTPLANTIQSQSFQTLQLSTTSVVFLSPQIGSLSLTVKTIRGGR